TPAALPPHNSACPLPTPTCSSPDVAKACDPPGMKVTALLALPRHRSARDSQAVIPAPMSTSPHPTCWLLEMPIARELPNSRGWRSTTLAAPPRHDNACSHP